MSTVPSPWLEGAYRHSAVLSNLNDNSSLNPDNGDWGYTVFGRVVEGLDVLENWLNWSR